MTNRKNTSASRVTLGAVLLALAATASSCGTALPTAPALDTGVTARQNAAPSMGEPVVTDDSAPNVGGPGDQPPPGEEIIPTPGPQFPGNSAFGHSHKKPK